MANVSGIKGWDKKTHFVCKLTGDKDKFVAEVNEQSKSPNPTTKAFAEVEMQTTAGMSTKSRKMFEGKAITSTIRVRQLKEGAMRRVPYLNQPKVAAQAKAKAQAKPKAKAKAKAKSASAKRKPMQRT